MEYRTMYKCRLCGKIFPCHITMDRQIAFKGICSCITGSEFKDGIKPEIYTIHSCEGGNMGVSDFIGIKEEDEGGGHEKDDK